MFNLAEWPKTTMVNGVTKGQVNPFHVSMKSVEYLEKGIFTEPDIQYIAENAIEPITEVPVVEEPPIEG